MSPRSVSINGPHVWNFDLEDRVVFDPLDPTVPVKDIDDHERAQHRVHWWDDERVPEGLGSVKVGKKAAGRLLDGVEHNARPMTLMEAARAAAH